MDGWMRDDDASSDTQTNLLDVGSEFLNFLPQLTPPLLLFGGALFWGHITDSAEIKSREEEHYDGHVT